MVRLRKWCNPCGLVVGCRICHICITVSYALSHLPTLRITIFLILVMAKILLTLTHALTNLCFVTLCTIEIKIRDLICRTLCFIFFFTKISIYNVQIDWRIHKKFIDTLQKCKLKLSKRLFLVFMAQVFI